MEVLAKRLDIVVLGNFNPKIINPYWLIAKEFISELSYKVDKKDNNYISHPEVSQFNLEFCLIKVFLDRFELNCLMEEYFEKSLELAINIFSSLPETPVLKMGTNLSHLVKLKDEQWKSFGDILAPKKVWGNVLEDPGLSMLRMVSIRGDGEPGFMTVEIQEMNRKQKHLSIKVNDHYDISIEDPKTDYTHSCRKMLDLLNNNKETIVPNSEEIITNLIVNIKGEIDADRV